MFEHYEPPDNCMRHQSGDCTSRRDVRSLNLHLGIYMRGGGNQMFYEGGQMIRPQSLIRLFVFGCMSHLRVWCAHAGM